MFNFTEELFFFSPHFPFHLKLKIIPSQGLVCSWSYKLLFLPKLVKCESKSVVLREKSLTGRIPGFPGLSTQEDIEVPFTQSVQNDLNFKIHYED
jgi:hypothetical protein